MKYFLSVFCTLFYLGAYAQTTAVKFEPHLISDDGIFGLTISPDSQTALWVKSNGKRDTLYLMESHKVNNTWSKPQIALFSTSKGEWKDIDPMFTPDGKTVLFQSTRPTAQEPTKTDFDIWAVSYTNNTWGKPYHLGNVVNSKASESYASMANNGNIYFMKENEDKIGKSDIYVATLQNGVYQLPKNIGMPINTSNRESNPYISPDEDYIIYFSSDSTGFGEVDLYISFQQNGHWSKPQNLGQTINSNLAEFCPFVHQKEKRLYFSRQQKLSDRMLENSYFITFDVEQYRPKK